MDISTPMSVSTACDDGCTFELSFLDIKALLEEMGIEAEYDNEVIVQYTATYTPPETPPIFHSESDLILPGYTSEESGIMTLDSGSELGFGNFNTAGNSAYLVYGSGETTEPDEVGICSYYFEVNKVDEDDTSNWLSGAEFELLKYDEEQGKYISSGITAEYGLRCSFVFPGLGEGDYRLVETKAPDGYSIGDPIDFTITCEIVEGIPNFAIVSDYAGVPNDFSWAESAVTVTNAKLPYLTFALPDTGSIGTCAIYGVGIMLLCVAALVLKKRSRNE